MRRFILERCVFPVFLGVLPYLFVETIHPATSLSATEEKPSKTVGRLIEDLKNDSFEIRAAATGALKERVDAIPALLNARHTADLEVRRLLEEILTALDRKRALHGLAKVKRLAKAGRLVEAADRLAFAAKRGIPAEECWGSLTKFAEQIIERTDRYFPLSGKFHANLRFPQGDFRRFAELCNPKELAGAKIEIYTGNKKLNARDKKALAGIKLIRRNMGKLLLRGEEVSLTANPKVGLDGGIIAVSGEVQLSRAVYSLIIAGGDVTKIATLRNCIVICDGDVEFISGGDLARTSIIVARGKVIYDPAKFMTTNCLIRSGHTLRSPDEQLPDKKKTIELNGGTPDPLGFIKFFELADVGLAAEDLPPRENSATKGTQIKEVRKESSFAAGLRPGDVITAVEGKKTPTTEVFRKTLRRTLAEGGPLITFTVQRAGKTLEVPIPVKD